MEAAVDVMETKFPGNTQVDNSCHGVPFANSRYGHIAICETHVEN